MTKLRPAGVQINKRLRTVTIQWNDGHESAYRFDGLRAVCPCVACKGGHAHMGVPPNPLMVRDAPVTDLTVENVQQVGAYALQFFWSDGHATGIYTWGMLRQACPCDQCVASYGTGADADLPR